MHMRSIVRTCATVSGLLAAAGCGGGIDVEDEPETLRLGQTSQAFTATQPEVRPTIYDFSASQRSTLVNGMLAFITQPVLDEHANAHDWHHPAVGELFFSRHHDYLNQLEAYLLNNALGAFVPVPEWDPGTPIPNEFMVTDPLVSQAAMNQNPNMPVPGQFADSELCEFADANEMAQTVETWHDQVHGAVGGAMGVISSAPGAPIFWLWHGLLDDMYHERTWRCQLLPAHRFAIPYPDFAG
jgi:hypothetical protein